LKVVKLRPLKIMSKKRWKLLSLLLPNCCLFYSYAWSSFHLLPEQREAFGAPDVYLDIKYSGYSKRNIQSSDFEAIDFDGVLATDISEAPVKGRRFQIKGNTWYTFYVGENKFLGWITQGKQGCEPNLEYQLEKNGKVIKQGTMKAGFCYPS